MFKKEHPDVKIGRSTFAKLKPLHVLQRREISKDACLCLYLQNIILLCGAIYKAIPNFPKFSGDFVGNMVRSTNSELCMMGNCQVCKDKIDKWFGSFERPDFKKKTANSRKTKKTGTDVGRKARRKNWKRNCELELQLKQSSIYQKRCLNVMCMISSKGSKAIIFNLSWSVFMQKMLQFKSISAKIILFGNKVNCSQHIGTKFS